MLTFDHNILYWYTYYLIDFLIVILSLPVVVYLTIFFSLLTQSGYNPFKEPNIFDQHIFIF